MKKIIYIFLLIGILSCGDDEPETPTCDEPTGVNSSALGENSVTLNWDDNGDSFELEFGIAGFNLGADEGQTIFTSSNQKTITNLIANTAYQYYIRTNCSNDNLSNWEGPFDVTTSHGQCPNVIDVYNYEITDTTAIIVWEYPSGSMETPSSSIVEYGIVGFTVGNGTSIPTANRDYVIENLTPSTNYEYYITSVCNTFEGNPSGPYSFSTVATCQKPYDLEFYNIKACGFSFYWQIYNETAWEIEYGESGFTLGTGTVMTTSSQDFTVTGLESNKTYEVYVRSNCGSDGYSEYSDPLVVTTNSINTYLGTYYYESVTDSAFGIPVFGDAYNVEITEVSTNTRSITVGYLGSSDTINFEFELTCDGKINVKPNQITTLQCTTGTDFIELGPTTVVQNYTMDNDYELEFTFWELYNGTGDCGASNLPVTIRLTKQ